ncbi:MAG: CDP-diacylglycerol--serine O-phosphatidyltransferase, partial [Alphaproteobacteria bacterium]
WQLEGRSEAAWLAALVFAVACVLRLARFNLARSDEDGVPKVHFSGVPAPAGALLALMPMYVAFASDGALAPAPWMTAAWLVLVGLAMISTLPTPSAKGVRVGRGNARFVVLGFVLMLAAAATWPWPTLIALCAGYVLAVAVFNLRRRAVRAEARGGGEKIVADPLHNHGEND